jgi:hypothetical protein
LLIRPRGTERYSPVRSAHASSTHLPSPSLSAKLRRLTAKVATPASSIPQNAK